jgi:chromosome segregation ATPase
MYVAIGPGQTARDVLATALSRDWIDRPALDLLRDHRPVVEQQPVLLSPQTLRGLWRELDDLATQRYHLTQAVDRVERTLHTKTGDLKDTLKRLDDSRARIDSAQQRLDGLDTPWSRFRNRDTIDTLRSDIDRSAGWVREYETRATTLRAEITVLTGDRDRVVAQRNTARAGRTHA